MPSLISRGPIDLEGISRYSRRVKTLTRKLPAIFLALLMLGCPLRPRDDETTDGADGGTGTAEPSAEPGAAEPLACEAELEKVKAELAACQAAK